MNKLQSTRQELQIKELLSMSQLMTRISSREDLLDIMNDHLKKIVDFTCYSILTLSADRSFFRPYIPDPAIVTGDHPVIDNVFNVMLAGDHPVVLHIDALTAEGAGYPPYIAMYRASGIRELVGIQLRNEKEKFGLLILCSDSEGRFESQHLTVIGGIGALISVGVSTLMAAEDIRHRETEREQLLELSHDIARIQDKQQLLQLINSRLKQIFYFRHSNIVAIDEDRQTFSSFLRDPASSLRSHPEYDSYQTAHFSVHDVLLDKVLNTEDPVIFDLYTAHEKGQLPDYLRMAKEYGMREIAAIALPGEKAVFGVLSFFTDEVRRFDAASQKIIKGVASLVAIAISNIMANEAISKAKLEKEMLLSLSYEMAKVRDRQELLTIINTKMRNLFYFTHSSISMLGADGRTFIVYLTDPDSRTRRHPNYQDVISATYPVYDGVFETFLLQDEPVVSDYDQVMLMKHPPKYAIAHHAVGLKEAVSVRLYGEQGIWGVLHFYSDRKGSFKKDNMGIIRGVASQVAVSISNILAHERNQTQMEEIRKYKNQLEQENFYLQEEINTSLNSSELIGKGPAMQRVYRLMSQVAHAGTTVLILGETGTGKELIARAIHNSSPQRAKLMVKVNCATLPANLIESELFGHEKGSFTGAVDRRIGKFELADNSTLFLDEIGELPPELQAKLLRAIQEKEIERLGGKHTITVNVRIIAATNRDLQREVAEGKFRSDLFYRLNVFPILLPPLRSRKEDIPALVHHFLTRYARNAGKKIEGVSRKVMDALMAYHWPGNVRELEHLVERSILLTEGTTIRSMPQLNGQAGHLPGETEPLKPLKDVEREYILAVLKYCKGKIQGIGGAAEILKIPATTLHSKMKKLGIKKSRTAQ